MVVGGDLQDYWYEVDARTGKLIGKLEAPESPNSHNLNLSADGKTAFMSPNNKVMTISDVKSRKVIKTIRFPGQRARLRAQQGFDQDLRQQQQLPAAS